VFPWLFHRSGGDLGALFFVDRWMVRRGGAEYSIITIRAKKWDYDGRKGTKAFGPVNLSLFCYFIPAGNDFKLTRNRASFYDQASVS
jgi:hypothetical protein